MTAPMIARRVRFTMLKPVDACGTAELRYNPDDPYIVTIAFPGPDESCTEKAWEIARELLDEGLRRHAGLGDIRLWPDDDHLMVAMSPPDGTAVLRFRHDQALRFLLATYRAVPEGDELVDLDGLVGQLLGGAR